MSKHSQFAKIQFFFGFLQGRMGEKGNFIFTPSQFIPHSATANNYNTETQIAENESFEAYRVYPIG